MAETPPHYDPMDRSRSLSSPPRHLSDATAYVTVRLVRGGFFMARQTSGALPS